MVGVCVCVGSNSRSTHTSHVSLDWWSTTFRIVCKQAISPLSLDPHKHEILDLVEWRSTKKSSHGLIIVMNWSKTIVFLYCLGSITSLAYLQVQKIWQFFSKILEKLVKSTLESMIFQNFPNSFYQKKTTFVCVCVWHWLQCCCWTWSKLFFHHRPMWRW